MILSKNIRQSLMTQISVSVALTTACILFLAGLYRYNQDRQNLENKLEQDLEWTAKTLAASLSLPIYNYANSTVKSICKATMEQKNIMGLSVTLDENTTLYFSKNEKGEIVQKTSPEPHPHCTLYKTPIVFNNTTISSLTIYMSKDELERTLRNSIRLNAITFCILALFLGIMLILLLKIRFVRPITYLTQKTMLVAQGKLDTEINPPNTTEFASLTDSFNNMRSDIKKQMNTLQDEIKARITSEEELLNYKNHLEEIIEERTADLKKSQDELIEYANQAGKAEIATGVLHNIGNVLTSLVVSTDRLKKSLVNNFPEKLEQALQLLDEHKNNIGEYLDNDPKGKALLHLIYSLPQALKENRENHKKILLKIFDSLELIKESVSAQQAYATQSDFKVEFPLVEEIERALSLEKPSLQKYNIEVILDFKIQPQLVLNKSKFTNALVNLIRNAKESLKSSENTIKRICITTEKNKNGIAIAVQDTGIGIEKENIEKIFSYGFTTRVDGHGFGLHQSINDIKSMGGEITVFSEGLGTGATFTIYIPAENVI